MSQVVCTGNRVSAGEQISIGHNYVSMSRKEFGLEDVSPIKYQSE